MWEFDGYRAMDKELFWKGEYTRVTPAEGEVWRTSWKHRAHGQERFDEQVWEYEEACDNEQKDYTPDWEEVDARCMEHPDEEHYERHADGEAFTPHFAVASDGAAGSKEAQQ